MLDDIGEARHLRGSDTHGIGQRGGSAGCEHASANRADNGQGSDGGHQALSAARE
jgi:hypothetical protein